MEKTLFVSDLDGTLLGDDQQLSQYTKETLNSLMHRGMLFAYATARSPQAAASATKGISDNTYRITYNGTFISRDKFLHQNFFTKEQVENILISLLSRNIYPTVYSFINNKERASYYVGNPEAVKQSYRHIVRDDARCNPVSNLQSLRNGQVFYFAVKFEFNTLVAVYNSIKDQYNCLFYKDAYDGLYWLEIQPENASKAKAVLKLKHILGCDRVICFGDGANDASMFAVCDQAYAVYNAEEQIKELASGVIPSNNQDGVATWLKAYFENA